MNKAPDAQSDLQSRRTPTGDVIIMAVGDVGPERKDPSELFALTKTFLSGADIAFCQLEFVLSDRGERLPQVRHTVRAHPRAATALVEAGFNVVSFAGNHCLDFGAEALRDTKRHLTAAGAAVVGVGDDITEARQPVIRDIHGTRVAFLAYSSVLPQGFWATASRAGCAPMRAFTFYEQVEHDQPGTPARIHTFAHREDLDQLRHDIENVRQEADIVIVSVHWGIHFIPAVIADYQRDVGHAAIDAGADALLGHHAHILKGVEIYRDKPIFYSLANYAMDLRVTPKHVATPEFREIQKLNPEWIPNFDSTYNFPPDSRKTIIVRLEVRDGELRDVAFLPGWINDNSQTEPLTPGDPRHGQVVSYLRDITKTAGLETEYLVDEALVRPVSPL
jgi:poly-gamma-glutamate capsule biosynthesis protein CapA/YwtB (metallophosphatase superfamily)